MARGRRNVDAVLLGALACGATFEAAAQKAGVSLATVTRRMQDHKFKKLLNQSRADMVQRTAGTLTAAATEAVRTLLELLKGSGTPSIRLNAAKGGGCRKSRLPMWFVQSHAVKDVARLGVFFLIQAANGKMAPLRDFQQSRPTGA
jgi:hypothetical protein